MHRAGSWPALLAFPRQLRGAGYCNKLLLLRGLLLGGLFRLFLGCHDISSCWWDPTDDPYDRREQTRYAVPRRDPLPTNV